MSLIADSYKKADKVLTVVLEMHKSGSVRYEDMAGFIHDALLDARNLGYRTGYKEATKKVNTNIRTIPKRFSNLPKTVQWVYKSWRNLVSEEEVEMTEEDWQEQYEDYITEYNISSVKHFVDDLCDDALHIGFVIDPREKEVKRL